MQARTIALGTLALLATGFTGYAAGRTAGQDAPTARPGKQHAWLASLAGEYTGEVGGLMGGADSTSRIESIMGGFWTVTHFESSMMGQPFQGMELMGYDPLKKAYISVWIDSTTPLLQVMEGSYDADAKALTMKGPSVAMDGEVAEMVNTTTFREDGMRFEMMMEGVPTPMMTIDSTRKP